MTTKYKIILGFLVMIGLLGAMAVLGYLDLQKASDGFTSYRRQARVNIYASDMQSNLYLASSKNFDFLNSYDEKTLEEGMKAVDQFVELAKIAESETHIASRKEALQKMARYAGPYRAEQNDIREAIKHMQDSYNNRVRPSYNVMTEQLAQLGKAAVRLQNYDAMYTLTLIELDFAHCLSALGRFAESSDAAAGAASKERMLKLTPLFDTLKSQLMSEGGARMYATLVASWQDTMAAIDGMIADADEVRESAGQLRALENEIAGAINEFNARVGEERRAEGTATLESNDRAQKITLVLSAIGLVIGAALAAFIIFGLVRVLNDLSAFATAVASGDFEHQVRTREKGEIGAMVAAMKDIPATLKKVLDEYRHLEQAIEDGKLSIQGNAESFKGGFATLIRGTNAILGRFLTVLEHIPSPVVILNRELKAAYINTIARKLAGEAYQGKTCFELFAREDYGTDKDALKRAVDSKAPVSAETIAHPQGKVMDVSYTAIPMTNAKGQLSSVMQLITDLTEIRSQQRIMMNVANQASEISNRVAAASEELSAQVEQVSRGAEMQRDRVESTASAMTEMNSTVLEVARSAGEASEQSEKTRQKANDGSLLVNKVVQAINQVNTVAMTLQGNMQELGGQAENIGGVMNVISDIADQTNLLALNAAIEAARAGEAGRGFAVVADEVRKLAEKTMQATHEVGSSITAIQQSARTNIDEVGNAVRNINEATGLANSSGESLKEIVDLASSNSAVVASIATAAEQQSATSEEINKAIEEINRVVGETTEGMIQSSSAVQELSQMAQELRRVMDGLK